jgi:hypothetical protein
MSDFSKNYHPTFDLIHFLCKLILANKSLYINLKLFSTHIRLNISYLYFFDVFFGGKQKRVFFLQFPFKQILYLSKLKN